RFFISTLDLATNWLLLPASSTDEQTIPSKNHLNSTLNRKCGGTSADGQPPLKRSDGLGTRSNFFDLYLNRSSPSGSDLMPGTILPLDSSPVYRPLARTSSLIPPNLSMDVSSSIRDPLTSLSLSLPGSDPPETDSGPACRICSRTTSPPPSPSTVASQQAPMIPQELPEMGLEKKMLNPEFLGGDACRR
ncbi:Transcription factor MYB44, partial [Linum perenne]